MRTALQQLRTQAGDMAVRAQAAADDAAAQRADAEAAALKAAEELAGEQEALAALKVRDTVTLSVVTGGTTALVADGATPMQ